MARAVCDSAIVLFTRKCFGHHPLYTIHCQAYVKYIYTVKKLCIALSVLKLLRIGYFLTDIAHILPRYNLLQRLQKSAAGCTFSVNVLL